MISVKEVLEAEETWARAHLEKDVEVLRELMHPDYTIIKSDGSLWNRETSLVSYIQEDRHWEEAKSSNHIVNIYGETAMVIGIWYAKGVHKGEVFDYRARYTSLWVKESGKLMIVLDQSTNMA